MENNGEFNKIAQLAVSLDSGKFFWSIDVFVWQTDFFDGVRIPKTNSSAINVPYKHSVSDYIIYMVGGFNVETGMGIIP